VVVHHLTSVSFLEVVLLEELVLPLLSSSPPQPPP
jgi:hypothetical protein